MGSIGSLFNLSNTNLSASQERHIKEYLGVDYTYIDKIEKASEKQSAIANRELSKIKKDIIEKVPNIRRRKMLLNYIDDLKRN